MKFESCIEALQHRGVPVTRVNTKTVSVRKVDACSVVGFEEDL